MDEQQVRQIAREEIAKAIRFILTEVDATTQNHPQNQIPEIPADLQKYVVIDGAKVKTKGYVPPTEWGKLNDIMKANGKRWVKGEKHWQ